MDSYKIKEFVENIYESKLIFNKINITSEELNISFYYKDIEFFLLIDYFEHLLCYDIKKKNFDLKKIIDKIKQIIKILKNNKLPGLNICISICFINSSGFLDFLIRQLKIHNLNCDLDIYLEKIFNVYLCNINFKNIKKDMDISLHELCIKLIKHIRLHICDKTIFKKILILSNNDYDLWDLLSLIDNRNIHFEIINIQYSFNKYYYNLGEFNYKEKTDSNIDYKINFFKNASIKINKNKLMKLKNNNNIIRFKLNIQNLNIFLKWKTYKNWKLSRVFMKKSNYYRIIMYKIFKNNIKIYLIINKEKNTLDICYFSREEKNLKNYIKNEMKNTDKKIYNFYEKLKNFIGNFNKDPNFITKLKNDQDLKNKYKQLFSKIMLLKNQVIDIEFNLKFFDLFVDDLEKKKTNNQLIYIFNYVFIKYYPITLNNFNFMKNSTQNDLKLLILIRLTNNIYRIIFVNYNSNNFEDFDIIKNLLLENKNFRLINNDFYSNFTINNYILKENKINYLIFKKLNFAICKNNIYNLKLFNEEIINFDLFNDFFKNYFLNLLYEKKYLILINCRKNNKNIINGLNYLLNKKFYTLLKLNFDGEILNSFQMDSFSICPVNFDINEYSIEIKDEFVDIKNTIELYKNLYNLYILTLIHLNNYLELIDKDHYLNLVKMKIPYLINLRKKNNSCGMRRGRKESYEACNIFNSDNNNYFHNDFKDHLNLLKKNNLFFKAKNVNLKKIKSRLFFIDEINFNLFNDVNADISLFENFIIILKQFFDYKFKINKKKLNKNKYYLSKFLQEYLLSLISIFLNKKDSKIRIKIYIICYKCLNENIKWKFLNCKYKKGNGELWINMLKVQITNLFKYIFLKKINDTIKNNINISKNTFRTTWEMCHLKSVDYSLFKIYKIFNEVVNFDWDTMKYIEELYKDLKNLFLSKINCDNDNVYYILNNQIEPKNINNFTNKYKDIISLEIINNLLKNTKIEEIKKKDFFIMVNIKFRYFKKKKIKVSSFHDLVSQLQVIRKNSEDLKFKINPSLKVYYLYINKKLINNYNKLDYWKSNSKINIYYKELDEILKYSSDCYDIIDIINNKDKESFIVLIFKLIESLLILEICLKKPSILDNNLNIIINKAINNFSNKVVITLYMFSYPRNFWKDIKEILKEFKLLKLFESSKNDCLIYYCLIKNFEKIDGIFKININKNNIIINYYFTINFEFNKKSQFLNYIKNNILFYLNTLNNKYIFKEISKLFTIPNYVNINNEFQNKDLKYNFSITKDNKNYDFYISHTTKYLYLDFIDNDNINNNQVTIFKKLLNDNELQFIKIKRNNDIFFLFEKNNESCLVKLENEEINNEKFTNFRHFNLVIKIFSSRNNLGLFNFTYNAIKKKLYNLETNKFIVILFRMKNINRYSIIGNYLTSINNVHNITYDLPFLSDKMLFIFYFKQNLMEYFIPLNHNKNKVNNKVLNKFELKNFGTIYNIFFNEELNLKEYYFTNECVKKKNKEDIFGTGIIYLKIKNFNEKKWFCEKLKGIDDTYINNFNPIYIENNIPYNSENTIEYSLKLNLFLNELAAINQFEKIEFDFKNRNKNKNKELYTSDNLFVDKNIDNNSELFSRSLIKFNKNKIILNIKDNIENLKKIKNICKAKASENSLDFKIKIKGDIKLKKLKDKLKEIIKNAYIEYYIENTLQIFTIQLYSSSINEFLNMIHIMFYVKYEPSSLFRVNLKNKIFTINLIKNFKFLCTETIDILKPYCNLELLNILVLKIKSNILVEVKSYNEFNFEEEEILIKKNYLISNQFEYSILLLPKFLNFTEFKNNNPTDYIKEFNFTKYQSFKKKIQLNKDKEINLNIPPRRFFIYIVLKKDKIKWINYNLKVSINEEIFNIVLKQKKYNSLRQKINNHICSELIGLNTNEIYSNYNNKNYNTENNILNNQRKRKSSYNYKECYKFTDNLGNMNIHMEKQNLNITKLFQINYKNEILPKNMNISLFFINKYYNEIIKNTIYNLKYFLINNFRIKDYLNLDKTIDGNYIFYYGNLFKNISKTYFKLKKNEYILKNIIDYKNDVKCKIKYTLFEFCDLVYKDKLPIYYYTGNNNNNLKVHSQNSLESQCNDEHKYINLISKSIHHINKKYKNTEICMNKIKIEQKLIKISNEDIDFIRENFYNYELFIINNEINSFRLFYKIYKIDNKDIIGFIYFDIKDILVDIKFYLFKTYRVNKVNKIIDNKYFKLLINDIKYIFINKSIHNSLKFNDLSTISNNLNYSLKNKIDIKNNLVFKKLVWFFENDFLELLNLCGNQSINKLFLNYLKKNNINSNLELFLDIKKVNINSKEIKELRVLLNISDFGELDFLRYANSSYYLVSKNLIIENSKIIESKNNISLSYLVILNNLDINKKDILSNENIDNSIINYLLKNIFNDFFLLCLLKNSIVNNNVYNIIYEINKNWLKFSKLYPAYHLIIKDLKIFNNEFGSFIYSNYKCFKSIFDNNNSRIYLFELDNYIFSFIIMDDYLIEIFLKQKFNEISNDYNEIKMKLFELLQIWLFKFNISSN